MKSVVLIGDSNTRRGVYRGMWVQRLTERLAGRYDVFNRGMSGYTAPTAYARREWFDLDKIQNVSLVTLSFGSNDCADPVLGAKQHVELSDYEHNMRMLIEYVLNEAGQRGGPRLPRDKLLVILPPPIDDEMFIENFGNHRKTDATVAVYRERLRALCDEYGLHYVDIAEMFKGITYPLFVDGLHINQDAGKLLADAVLEYMGE